MMKNFVMLLLAAEMFCGCSNGVVEEDSVPLVLVQKVTISGSAGTGHYPGQIKGRYESVLAFQTGGKITARSVKRGDFVHEGDILMTLDPEDIKESLAISVAQLNEAKSRLELAETDHQRQTKLFQEAVVSQARFDQSLNTVETARSGYRQAEARYKQNSNMLDYTVLRAESNGIVTELSAEAGQVVSAGQPVLTFVQSGEFEAEFHVPENNNGSLYEGMDIAVSFWAEPDEQVAAVIQEISQSADAYTRTFKVRAGLIDPPAWVKLGMSVSVAIPKETNEIVYTIPATALYHNNDKAYVWVLLADDTVHMREVAVKKYESTAVQINQGLVEDDYIVVTGVHKLFENQTVRMVSANRL